MAQQGPSLEWQHKRNAAIARGFDQPAMPPSQGPYPSPMPAIGGPPPNNNFYPPGQGIQYGGIQYGATGISDIGGAGESIYGNAAPVQLSAPGGLAELVAAIKAEATKQGLSPSQISSILGAFKGLGAGAGAGGAADWSSNISQGVGGYSGGISDLGYAPLGAPGADFDPYRGGWICRYDPTLMIPTF